MKIYTITEDKAQAIIRFCDDIPTRWGRQLQDYLSQNLVEVKEEPKEQNNLPEDNKNG